MHTEQEDTDGQATDGQAQDDCGLGLTGHVAAGCRCSALIAVSLSVASKMDYSQVVSQPDPLSEKEMALMDAYCQSAHAQAVTRALRTKRFIAAVTPSPPLIPCFCSNPMFAHVQGARPTTSPLDKST